MKRHGFSLVELSIVLVILGLLTGGILTGQSLIRAAELRSVVSDAEQYLAASYTFRNKYFAIAGDMPNAIQFWGVSTFNGNGNGEIDVNWTNNTDSERLVFWNHLANSGLVPGKFTGISGPAGSYYLPEINAPKARLSGGIFGPVSHQTTGDTWKLDTKYFNSLVFATFGGGGDLSGAILLPEEAWNIDKKFDDGKPARGKVQSMNWQWGCMQANVGVLASDNTELDYNLSEESVQCNLIFNNYF